MDRILTILTVMLVITCFACNEPAPQNKESEVEPAWQTIERPGYMIEVPGSMHEMDQSVASDADLVYGDEGRELYMMVIREDEREIAAVFPDSVSRLGEYTAAVAAQVDSLATESIKVGSSNGRESRSFDVITSDSLYYSVNVIYLPGFFYQVHTWTLAEQKSDYRAEIHKILHSLATK